MIIFATFYTPFEVKYGFWADLRSTNQIVKLSPSVQLWLSLGYLSMTIYIINNLLMTSTGVTEMVSLMCSCMTPATSNRQLQIQIQKIVECDTSILASCRGLKLNRPR